MSDELKIETTISRDYKPTYDELTEEWIVPLNDKTCATIYGLSATEATANKLYEAWHKYNKAEPDYKAMYLKTSHEIKQILGKSLNYPWYKDDQKNFTGATEEDGVCTGEHAPETIAMEASRKIKELGNMCEEMSECLEYFSRLESYSDVGGIFQIKTDNIIYAKNILTKWNAMKGEE
jgi:hypothetical protein